MEIQMNYLKPGMIIKSYYWPEPVEIKKFEIQEEYLYVVGSMIRSHRPVDQVLSETEFDNIFIVELGTDFGAEAWRVFLALEMKRYRYASLYDPLLAMNTSKVDPLPHQIEAVYGYILKLPRIRFLLADDPGAGKTIMAGLVIKELKLRHLIERILIVTPGHLKDQWCREMKERFEETFVVIDRGMLNAHYAVNVWERENQIICSIDFSKQETVLPSLLASHFDMIIVDEAHKMSAYRYGDKTEKTSRYKLGEILSANTEHLLLLTATPHKGDPENFRLFLDLLEPGFFATTEMIQQSLQQKDNPLFLRRVKEDLKDFEGKPLFLPRYPKTIKFDLGVSSPKEKDLYNDLSKYVNQQYNKALQKDKRRNVAFALVILQRRLASSTFALFESLNRRKKRLTEMLDQVQNRQNQNSAIADFDEVEDWSEEDRWHEEEIWETLSVAENREELEREIETLNNLLEKAKRILISEDEIKLQELKRTLMELNEKELGEKILIFTESRDTLHYLEKKIAGWGYKVNTIHGGMRLEERIKAEKVFKNITQIMIATEAAGEGINLQFCHLMINYDIPWNPNRLEQRMGRIHRYGQTKEVHIFNLVATDTREGSVLFRIFEKLEEIKQSLGSDKVFDIIGDVFYGRNLTQLLLEAAASSRSMDEILKDVEIQYDESYISQIKENLGESLATHFIDYTRIKEMNAKAKEHRLIPEYTEAFFKKACVKAGGKLDARNDGFVTIPNIPVTLKMIAREDAFKKRYGTLLNSYPKVTFDKEIGFKTTDAEFVTFGHALFESVLEWIDRELMNDLQRGAVFVDPDGRKDGHIMFYEGEIKDGKDTIAGKRLFAYYVHDGNIESISPAVIWDLAEAPAHSQPDDYIDYLKNQTFRFVIQDLERYKAELLTERSRQTAIKEKYGAKSLEQLILKLDGDLIKLLDRKQGGENVDLVIRNKETQKFNYEQALRNLRATINQEKSLSMSYPRFLGAIRVMPLLRKKEAFKRDDETERIGMEIAMEFERKQDRVPEDVSQQNLGYDIRSTDAEGTVRFIEVKARTQFGPVELTQNEWFKARRFQADYFLYAVFNASSQSELYIIQDPANVLQTEEKVEIVRYWIPLVEIKEKGERVN